MDREIKIVSRNTKQYILKSAAAYLSAIFLFVFIIRIPPKTVSHLVEWMILICISILIGLTAYFFCRYRGCKLLFHQIGTMILELQYACGIFILLIIFALVISSPFIRIY